MSGRAWMDVSPAHEFDHGSVRLVEIDGINIAVINLGGEFYALQDKCSHADWPMFGCGLDANDIIEGETIICPRHGARFCIRTGAALNPPAYEPINCYPVRIVDGMVQTGLHHPD